MKCPYCAEQINDEAQVCRYCGREFMLLKPLLEKISSLEERGSEIAVSHDAHQTGAQHILSKLASTEPKWRQIRIAVLLPALISSVSLTIFIVVFVRQLEMQIDTANNTITIHQIANSPILLEVFWILFAVLRLSWFYSTLPFGLWAGLVWPGRHLKGYTLLALIVGLLTMIGNIGVYTLVGEVDAEHPALAAVNLQQWIVLLAFYLLGPALLFLSGGLFADLIKTRISPRMTREFGLTGKVVAKLSGPKQQPSKRMTLFIGTLGPSIIGLMGALISFAATIITVYPR